MLRKWQSNITIVMATWETLEFYEDVLLTHKIFVKLSVYVDSNPMVIDTHGSNHQLNASTQRNNLMTVSAALKKRENLSQQQIRQKT